MQDQHEHYQRWEPITELPEAPLSGFDCKFENGNLEVEAEYACSGIEKNLRMSFKRIEAFKVYEEFSDPWMATGLPLPAIAGQDHDWRWPLQEVVNSTWISRVKTRNGAIAFPWRHLVVVTMSYSLHVMTLADDVVVELGAD